jgi:hypothetical protein
LKEIRTEIELYSCVSAAWRVLTDFSTFHTWNPVIIQIIGKARLGEKLKISVRTSKGKNRIYRPIITKLEENHELRWKGKSFIPGFLNGERIFIFQEISRDHIRLLHSELFSGFGTIIAGRRLIEDVESNLQQMNSAFKKRVEHGI